MSQPLTVPSQGGEWARPPMPLPQFPRWGTALTAGSPQLTWQTRQTATVLDVVQEPTEGECGMVGRQGWALPGSWDPSPCQVPVTPAHRHSVLLAAFTGLYGEALPPRCWAADSQRAVLGTPQRSRTVSPGDRGWGRGPPPPVVTRLPVLCPLAGPAARGHGGGHRHQPDGRYAAPGCPRCPGEHP